MTHFGEQPRFELLGDGTVIARAGTQTNCGGIAKIHARLSADDSGVLTFVVAGPIDAPIVYDGSHVPGSSVPREYREAAERGVRQAFEERHPPYGVRFELIEALVHAVDANERKFERAGHGALLGWIERR